MPVPSAPRVNRHVGNGVTDTYPYSYRILNKTHIGVDVDGATLVVDVDYTVTGVGNSAGGNIVFTTAPANLAPITLTSTAPYERTATDYVRNGAFKEETVDADFDLLHILIQQIDERFGRGLSIPITDSVGVNVELPAAAARALKLAGFDEDGNATVYVPADLDLTMVSAFIAALLDDADQGTAQATLGVVPGTHVQPFDAELAALAGLTSAANKIPMFSGSGTATVIDFKDEDDMASDSATAVPSQQSLKAYVADLKEHVSEIVTKTGYSTFMVRTNAGRLIAWGDGSSYNTISGNSAAILAPTELAFPGETGTLVDAYGSIALFCALFDNGNLWTWGQNNYGQCGVGDTTSRQTPVLAATDVSEIFPPLCAGDNPAYSRLFIKKTDGKIYSAGYGLYGGLGLGGTSDASSFTEVTSLGTGVRKVWNFGGIASHTFAQKTDGTILFTGRNNYGAGGTGATTQVNSFTDVTTAWGGGTTEIADMVMYTGHYNGTTHYTYSTTLMLRGGTLRTCGDDTYGQIGNGASGAVTTPHTITGVSTTITQIAATGMSFWALGSDNKAWRWGYNAYGQCADGTTTDVTSPYNSGSGVDCAVTSLVQTESNAATNGHYSQMFLVSGGANYACGYNNYGGCGVGNNTTPVTSLTRMKINDVLTQIARVSTDNGGVSAGITATGEVYVWGYGGTNMIDISYTGNVYSPTQKRVIGGF